MVAIFTRWPHIILFVYIFLLHLTFLSLYKYPTLHTYSSGHIFMKCCYMYQYIIFSKWPPIFKKILFFLQTSFQCLLSDIKHQNWHKTSSEPTSLKKYLQPFRFLKMADVLFQNGRQIY